MYVLRFIRPRKAFRSFSRDLVAALRELRVWKTGLEKNRDKAIRRIQVGFFRLSPSLPLVRFRLSSIQADGRTLVKGRRKLGVRGE